MCFNNDEDVASTTSDDFIVVSKVFDLDTPLDEEEIRRRLGNFNSSSNFSNMSSLGLSSAIIKLPPSAFSMQVEQLKLERHQQVDGEEDSENFSENEQFEDAERYTKQFVSILYKCYYTSSL